MSARKPTAPPNHLTPAPGLGTRPGFVLANGSMSSNQSGEGDIRRALIEADREMSSDELRTPNRVSPTSTFEIHPSNFAALPGQLFYSTPIPVCLRFWGKNSALDSANDARLFDGETELSLVA